MQVYMKMGKENTNHLSSVRLRCNILTISALNTDRCKKQSVINPLVAGLPDGCTVLSVSF